MSGTADEPLTIEANAERGQTTLVGNKFPLHHLALPLGDLSVVVTREIDHPLVILFSQAI
jgi:hypothetical protein